MFEYCATICIVLRQAYWPEWVLIGVYKEAAVKLPNRTIIKASILFKKFSPVKCAYYFGVFYANADSVGEIDNFVLCSLDLCCDFIVDNEVDFKQKNVSC